MSSQGTPQYDDQTVVQYLLGAIPEEEACRLDELSVVDDDFAARLLAAENELVDSYVRGELAEEHLDRFRTYYLASESRREKVKFAQSLQSWADRAPEGSTRSARFGKRIWFSPRFAFAAATCVLLLAVGYLLYENGRLKGQFARVQVERTQQGKFPEQQTVAPQPLETQPAAPPRPRASVIAVVLSPQTRGMGPPVTVALAPTADHVEFRLELEPGEFAGYRVGLNDPAANRIVWRSGRLRSASRGESKVVPVFVPAPVLKAQSYTLELTGIPDRGGSELLSTYTFRVVR
jgi:hypothetical protein